MLYCAIVATKAQTELIYWLAFQSWGSCLLLRCARLCVVLQETLEAVEAENAEKQQLGTGKSYDRSLP